MNEEYTLFLVPGKETEKAICFSAGDFDELKPHFWLPRSEIVRITRFKEEPGHWRMARVTIPTWLAEKHDRDL